MEKENNLLLRKILGCLYVVIAILTLNLVVTIVSNKDKNETPKSAETNGDYDVSMFTEVDYDDLLDYFDKKGTFVVYVGSADCGYCIQFLPSLQQAQSAYGYKTLYLPIDKVSRTSDSYDKFIAKLDIEYSDDKKTGKFGEFYGYTPTMIIIKDGKQIDGSIGAMSYDAFAAFLEKNGITK